MVALILSTVSCSLCGAEHETHGMPWRMIVKKTTRKPQRLVVITLDAGICPGCADRLSPLVSAEV